MSVTPCPFLPVPDRAYTHEDIHALGKDRSERFYHTALHYAQTLWLTGFPAKSLLLINRALSCYLPGVSLLAQEKPYHAKAWILVNRPEDRFIGNPRRHYQHLATRMVPPHKELRTWRAWGCWYLAKQVLPEREFPSDSEQVRTELVVKPRRQEIADQLAALSPSDDLEAWRSAIDWARPWTLRQTVALPGPVRVEIMGVEGIPKVRELAHEIWPIVYPEIITEEQIQYMLHKMYAPDVLRSEIVVRGVVYALIMAGAEAIGYLAFEDVPQDCSVVLHRLYVRPVYHGSGVGAAVLDWLSQQARPRGVEAIRLRVNKRNVTAIRAYLRAGFVFDYDLCTDIGDGFVMDDHVLKKDLV